MDIIWLLVWAIVALVVGGITYWLKSTKGGKEKK